MLRRTLLILSLLICSSVLSADVDPPPPLSRIVFGSCVRQERAQPIWEPMVAVKPELFLFIGDCIYADTRDLTVMKAKWKVLEDGAGFKKMREACPMLATWDDHDLGENDCGGDYPLKKESQQLFLDFLRVPAESPRRTREGVYDEKTFGPPEKSVQVILLDTRYFRSPIKDGRSGVDGATILGEDQWKWLGEQLKKPAKLRIIASSIEVLADEHTSEKWGNFPKERARLFKLLNDSQAEGVIFVSGDRHFAELSRMDPQASGLPYPLYDFTSSSLNQNAAKTTKERVNRYRLGQIYVEPNFGLISMDWNKPEVPITFDVRDVQGKVVSKYELKLGDLKR